MLTPNLLIWILRSRFLRSLPTVVPRLLHLRSPARSDPLDGNRHRQVADVAAAVNGAVHDRADMRRDANGRSSPPRSAPAAANANAVAADTSTAAAAATRASSPSPAPYLPNLLASGLHRGRPGGLLPHRGRGVVGIPAPPQLRAVALNQLI